MSNIEKHFNCSDLFEVHKLLLQRYECTSKENTLSKCDEYLLRKNHKFLWQDKAEGFTWEEELAKKYYDKLFKEFCICDLSKYRSNQIALRWRTQKEVISGKGQFTCAEKVCDVKDHLRTWEVNFCYVEEQQKKNALVKIKLCTGCSTKLNFHSRKREVKRLKTRSNKNKKDSVDSKPDERTSDSIIGIEPGSSRNIDSSNTEDLPWTQKIDIDIKSRDEEMEDYLNELLF